MCLCLELYPLIFSCFLVRCCTYCGKVIEQDIYSNEPSFVKNAAGQVGALCCKIFFFFFALCAYVVFFPLIIIVVSCITESVGWELCEDCTR